MDDHSVTERLCALRPRSFIALMAVYESNWDRLHALAPALSRLQGAQLSRVHSDCDVHLELLERTRYTTTLRLTYLFEGEHHAGTVRDPDVVVRVYHDARQVEAMSCARVHRHEALRRFAAAHAELDRRWSRNMLLNKWLEYLLDCGHLFTGLQVQGGTGTAG